MSDFSNKSVIVTGGIRGLVRAFRGLLQRQARVACVDVDATAGAALVAETADAKGEVRFFEVDVSGGAACKEVCSRVIDRWDGIDVLCNNVGIQPVDSYVPAHELPDEMWDRIVDINEESYFLMAATSVPNMMERGGGGVIINTASVQGLQSALGVSAYAASKGGILSLTRQLALEYAPHKIRVLAVNPGGIQTPLVDELVEAQAWIALSLTRAMPNCIPLVVLDSL